MSAVELDEMFTASEISVQGSVAAGFEKVKDVFQAQFQRGEEISAQLCIYRRGKQVVDLWASRDDPSYSGDSLQTIWSSTKNLTSLAVAMLVDQGFLNFSDRISQHWPEFGQCGKAGITVADMLRHEGGLSTIAAKLDIQDCFPENLRNNRVAQVLEKELPHWPEDCKREYHAITRGAVIQELFRRVDPKGRSIGQFLREELLIDLEADVFIGLSKAEQREKHIADLRAFPAAELKEHGKKKGRLDLAESVERAGEMPILEDIWTTPANLQIKDPMSFWNSTDCRRAEIPSAGGLASARGLAKVANMLCQENGGPLGKKGFSAFHADPTPGVTFGMSTFFTQGGVNHFEDGPKTPMEVGWGLRPCEGWGLLVPRGLYGWGGFGGSVFVWDLENQIGFVYVPTYLAWYDREKQRGTRLLNSFYSCLADADAEN